MSRFRVAQNAEDKMRTIDTLQQTEKETAEKRERDRMNSVCNKQDSHLTGNYTVNWTRLALNASKHHHSNRKFKNYKL